MRAPVLDPTDEGGLPQGCFLLYPLYRMSNVRPSSLQAYLSGYYILEQVGEHFGVSYASVSRAVKQFEERG